MELPSHTPDVLLVRGLGIDAVGQNSRYPHNHTVASSANIGTNR